MSAVTAGPPVDERWPTPIIRPSRRARRRRRVRRAAAIVLAVVSVSIASFAVLWAVTPGVGDAEARIQAQDRAVGAVDSDLPTPPKVAAALIATEDSRFYSTIGVDPVALPRAASGLLGLSSDQGGATLEQQLAKMVYTPAGGGPATKIEQVVLAFKLDDRYSKAQILEMYLSVAYFGHGFYGLPAASTGYFRLSPAQLSWGQASLLAGLVQAPSAYDPLAHYDLARSRQRHVLDRLVATGKLTAAQADAAYAAPLGLV